jgi:hypothetical protein
MSFNLASIPDSTVISTSLLILASMFNLSRKDKEELDLKKRDQRNQLVNQSFSDKTNLFTAYDDFITKTDLANFEQFRIHLQHICVLILSEATIETVFEHIYYPFIKKILEKKAIERFSKVLDLSYSEKEYKYLFDAYELGRKKFKKKVKKKWWEVC